MKLLSVYWWHNEILRNNQQDTTDKIQMGDGAKTIYDLGERTLQFAIDVKQYIFALPRNVPSAEISKQLMRAAGAVGANYLEANDALGKKDFVMRAKIARREAKETRYWLELTDPVSRSVIVKKRLIGEATEIIKILSAIIAKTN